MMLAYKVSSKSGVILHNKKTADDKEVFAKAQFDRENLSSGFVKWLEGGFSLLLKRIFDILTSLFALIILAPVILWVSLYY